MFSQAASSHNGFALFIDDTGIDHYNGEQARAESNEYHGGSSLSIFIDGGGEHDIYSFGENNSVIVQDEFGIRADFKETVRNVADDEDYFIE